MSDGRAPRRPGRAESPSGTATAPFVASAPFGAPTADDLAPGLHVEVDVTAVAHGGHCVARYDGRVLFVRLALPGERVVARITEARPGSFGRAEAVRVLDAHPGRVEPPCQHFRPGGCGGCDFQHADLSTQRTLKAAVVSEQLRRLGGLEVSVTVEPLPDAGGTPGLGWRSRVRWALDDDGRIGPRAVRSHRVQAVGPAAPCLIAAPGLSELAAGLNVPPEVRRSDHRRPSPGGAASRRRGRRAELPEVTLCAAGDGSTVAVWAGAVAPVVTEHAIGRDFEVAADGFWQVHPAAADALADAVDEALGAVPRPGAVAWDLYAGVGLFTEVLARRVGPDGAVLAVEGDEAAAELARRNLADRAQVTVEHGAVADVVAGAPEGPLGAVVLDPPRTGAGLALCDALAARRPAVIVYVACDPAALGRDTAGLAAAGYRLDTLRAFDAFPQTHHVECVARFVPA